MYFFSYPIIVAYLLNLHPSQRSWCFAFHIRSNLYLLQSCSYQALLSWAEQVDHQGKLLLFQPVVICSLEMRLIPNARAQLMQAPGTMHKISSGQRSPPRGTAAAADPRRSSTTRNATQMKAYETTLKGIESLNFDSDEKVHY